MIGVIKIKLLKVGEIYRIFKILFKTNCTAVN